MTMDSENDTHPLYPRLTHMLIELWGAKKLDGPALTEIAIRKSFAQRGRHYFAFMSISFVQSHVSAASWAESHVTNAADQLKSRRRSDQFR